MSNENYAAPQSQLVAETDSSEQLASRWSRLLAALLDGLIIMIVTLPVMYFTGGFDGITNGIEPSVTYNLVIGALGLAIFILVNGKLLISNGQTLGKKVLGIKIVDLNGDLPGLKQHLLKRYAVYFIPGQIPIAGQLFSFINILFIFGKQKRCIHDYLAGTKVVVKAK
ncbi:RDD family protein [Motiliproteus sp. MSK22-1]|uniref:RDD family protein n=1 Tax=Motiliproteus sp. MSK22-1 TaxID=1897630 RepID=UPI0009757185|nr:RDD family protein [Motiliproteus sp. MSK22-1]OMH28474.1 hypothetical protein BGP75_21510 [Motiliproteus sp. MSK22-1]